MKSICHMFRAAIWTSCLLTLLFCAAVVAQEQRRALQPIEIDSRAGIRAGTIDKAFLAQLERALEEAAPEWTLFARETTSDSQAQLSYRKGEQRMFVEVAFMVSAAEALQEMRSLPFRVSGVGQRAAGDFGPEGAIEYHYGGGTIRFRRTNVVISVSGQGTELETTRQLAQLIADAFPGN